MTTIEDLASQLQGNLDDSTADYLRLSQEALAPRRNTTQDVIAQAVASAIPLLVGGAVGGREGLVGGAAGGLQSYKAITGLQDERFQDERKSKLIEAQTAAETMRELRKTFNDLNTLQATEPFKQGLRADVNRELEDLRQGNRLQIEGIRDQRAANKGGVEAEKPTFKSDLAKEAMILARDPKTRGQLTPEHLAAISDESLDVQGEFRRVNETTAVQERFLANKEIEDLKTEIPGLVKIKEKVTTKDADLVKKKFAATSGLNAIIDELALNLAKNGQRLTGEAAVKQIDHIGRLLRIQKEIFGGGAAYTELEAMMANISIPKILSNPTVSLWDAMKESALGRDPLSKLKAMKAGAILEFKSTIKPYGFSYGDDKKVLSLDEFKKLSPVERNKLMGRS